MALGIAVVGSFMWTGYEYLGGDGTLELRYYFQTKPSAISLFGPSGRALDREQNKNNGETYQRIVNGPVYTDVTLPGAYDKVTVELEYQNPSQMLVELGIKLSDDPALFDYRMQPLENKLVDNSDWSRLENDQYIFLQRTSTYTSIEQFLANPPTTAKGGSYLVSPNLAYVDPDYQANTETGSTITTTLRGRHEFYTYAADENVFIQFTVADINYSADDDAVRLFLYQQDKLVAEVTLADDGELGITGIATGERTVALQLDNVPAGVYQIVFDATDDVIITQIQSDQERLVVAKSINLAGTEEYRATGITLNTTPTTLHTGSNWLTVIAKHTYGVADVVTYDRVLHINKVDTPYTWTNPISNYTHDITFPNNDVLVLSDSYFALPGAEAFDPWFGLRPISQYTNPDGLDYVISGHYDPPTRLRTWTTASATFDLTGIEQSRPNVLQFIVSAPGLETTSLGLKVRSITITAQQHPITLSYLWKKIRQ